MGKITINEIHKSLFSYIQAVSDESLETKDKTIVGAINELIQNSNSNKTEINNLINEISNGKKLIADAIGEPLDSNDTFSTMNNDINGLLSTFKTNMMNNGVSVAGSDKFKQLIDKLATLSDNEGKGIKFATGSLDTFKFSENYQTLNFNAPIGFVPTYLFVHFGYIRNQYSGNKYYNVAISNIKTTNIPDNSQLVNTKLTISNLSENGFSILGSQGATNETMYSPDFMYVTWYAIGVGEEDTTLRDSLADILENKGVDVTEEDDMASLITKVDSMTSNMIKYKSGIHEHTYDGNTRISFEVTGIGFRPTFVQVCRVNKSEADGGYAFWINNDYMNDSNSIYIQVASIWDLKTTTYSGLNAGAEYDELVVNDDGFSLNIITGGTSGDLWHFEWFVLG